MFKRLLVFPFTISILCTNFLCFSASAGWSCKLVAKTLADPEPPKNNNSTWIDDLMTYIASNDFDLDAFNYELFGSLYSGDHQALAEFDRETSIGNGNLDPAPRSGYMLFLRNNLAQAKPANPDPDIPDQRQDIANISPTLNPGCSDSPVPNSQNFATICEHDHNPQAVFESHYSGDNDAQSLGNLDLFPNHDIHTPVGQQLDCSSQESSEFGNEFTHIVSSSRKD